MNDPSSQLHFLDPPPELRNREEARFHVLPAPYEGTVSYAPGAARGPRAILEASRQVEFYNGVNEPVEQGIYTHPLPESLPSEPQEVADWIAGETRQILNRQAVPVIIGGEHTVSVGAFQALTESRAEPFGIVQFDAHADLRESYEGTIYSHACVMKRAIDLNIPIAQFGIRSLCREEDELRKHLDIPHWDARELAGNQEPEPILPDDFPDNIYITFDLDGLDPAVIPATGTPVPGGLSWYTALNLLEKITANRRILGFDVVELAPVKGNHAPDFAAAKLVYTIIGLT